MGVCALLMLPWSPTPAVREIPHSPNPRKALPRPLTWQPSAEARRAKSFPRTQPDFPILTFGEVSDPGRPSALVCDT